MAMRPTLQSSGPADAGAASPSRGGRRGPRSDWQRRSGSDWRGDSMWAKSPWEEVNRDYSAYPVRQ
eukprot:5312602-Pyramimonas_sp.AAC.1